MIGRETNAALRAFRRQCDRRSLDASRIEAEWDVRFVSWDGQPALSLGVDGLTSRRLIGLVDKRYSWHPSKRAGGDGGPALNGLERAQWHALQTGHPITLVNGEWSMFAAWQAGVPAVCSSVGEGAGLKGCLATQLTAAAACAGVGVWVAFDGDAAGQSGAQRAARALIEAGCADVHILKMPAWLGVGGDVDDLHRCVGDAGLAHALASLVRLAIVPSAYVVSTCSRACARTRPMTGRAADRESAYIRAALAQACAAVASAPEGSRNHTLNAQAFGIGGLIGAGRLDHDCARQALHAAAVACGLPPSEIRSTLARSLRQGAASPRYAMGNGTVGGRS